MTSLDGIVGFHMRKATLRAQSAIAEAAGLDRSSLVPILNKFEKDGLILRAAVAGDKRAYAVRLTEKGEAELEALEEKVKEIEAKVIAGLGAEDHARLIELLKKFHDII